MLRKSVFASLVNYPSFNPQLRLASAINGISYLAEVNGPYMISTSVSVGEGSKMNDLIIQKGILGSQVKPFVLSSLSFCHYIGLSILLIWNHQLGSRESHSELVFSA
jgi:hypothetical protein